MAVESFTFVDQEGNIHSYIPMASGPAVLAENKPEDMQLDKDQRGFTNPNLHRRIDPVDPISSTVTDGSQLHRVRSDTLYAQDNQSDSTFYPSELKAREYQLNVGGVHSYRTTRYTVHDEESTTSEIP